MHAELVETLSTLKPTSQPTAPSIISSSTNTSITPLPSESSLDSSPTTSTTASISSLQQNFSSLSKINSEDLTVSEETGPYAKRIKVNNNNNSNVDFIFSLDSLNQERISNENELKNISNNDYNIAIDNHEKDESSKNIKKETFVIAKADNLKRSNSISSQSNLKHSVLEKFLKNNMNTINHNNNENSQSINIKQENTNIDKKNLNINTLHKYLNKSTPVLTQVVSSKTANKLNVNDLKTNNCENDKMSIDIENVNSENTSSTDSNISTLTTQTTTITATNTNKTNNSNNKSLSKKTFACLRNLGSTCYINCIIQVMRYTPGFVLSIHRLNKQIDYLRSLNNKEIEIEIMQNNDIIFVINLHELLAEMSDKEKLDRRPIYTPRKFVNTVWTSLSFWSDGSQQDAHEFLQYTIHFINECDLFIRKLQQKYQIKQIPINQETCVKPINIVTTSSSQVATKPVSLINQNSTARVNTRSSARLAANSNTTTANNKKQTATKTKNDLVKCKSSNSLPSSQTSEIENQTEQIAAPLQDPPQSQPIPQPPPAIRLIKSMPKIKSLEKSESVDNFMRTPTKGGASAFNLNMLDSLTNSSNQSDSNSTKSNTTSDKVLNKIEINNHSNDYYNFTDNNNNNNNKNDDLVFKNQENSIFKSSNKRNNNIKSSHHQDDNEIIFRPLIKEDVVDNNKNTVNKLPIKVKFIKLDNKTEKYKMIDETSSFVNMNNNKNNSSIVDDKDLVSKRLRETINNSPVINKATIVSTNKKFKRDELIKNLNLNQDLDSNSFIIIDSDNEDSDIILNNSIQNNEIIKKETIEDENLLVDVVNVKAEEKIQHKFEQTSLTNKKLKLDIKKNSENENVLRSEPSSSSKLTATNESSVNTNTQKQTKINTRSSNNRNLKKLKSKSKTFPCTDKKNNKKEKTQIESSPVPTKDPITSQETIVNINSNINNEIEKTNNNEYFNDLDAITLISTEKSINNNYYDNNPNELTNVNSMKSKLRSSTSSLTSLVTALSPTPQHYMSPVKQTTSTTLVTTNTPNNTPTLNLGNNSAPPSPAELLRKYSTSIGYVCEMDKLFKGSSITVTQCLECENLRKCPEAFYDRSIPVDTNYSIDDEEEYNGVDWISKCLKNESYLNENSKYMCDICSSKQEAKIHTQYTQMPNILILHLLSYGITSSVDGNLNAQKLNNRARLVNSFDFLCTREQQHPKLFYTNDTNNSSFKSPITTRRQQQILNIQKSLAQSDHSSKNEFKLFAVVMHSGVSLNSGHYTAFVNYKIISQCENNDLDNLIRSNKNDKLCSCLLDNSNPNLNSNINSNSNNNLTSSNECLNNIDNSSTSQPEWLHFDDTKVKSLTSIEFHRKIVDSSYDSPYILFYVKE